MSISALNWAFAQKLPPIEKLVLLALADHCDVNGQCWPRHGLISEKTGLSDSGLRGAIKRLIERGLLAKAEHFREDGGRSSNTYHLVMGDANGPADTTPPPPSPGNGPPAVIRRTPASTKRTPASIRHPLTIIEPSCNQQVNKTPLIPQPDPTTPAVVASLPEAGAEASLPEWISPDSWKDYLDFRRKIKKPLTERAKANAIAKLAKWRDDGYDPNEIIDQCVLNGWQGLYLPKGIGRNEQVSVDAGEWERLDLGRKQ